MKPLIGLITLAVMGGMLVRGEQITVHADCWVARAADQNKNFGSHSTMTTTGLRRKSYLKFDVSSLTKTVTSSKLNLVVHSASQNPGKGSYWVEVFGIADRADLDGWDEGAITWKNAPANREYNALKSAAVSLGSFPVAVGTSAGTGVHFSSDALSDFINSDTDGYITLILLQDQRYDANPSIGESVAFGTKENTGYNAPSLTVTMAP